MWTENTYRSKTWFLGSDPTCYRTYLNTVTLVPVPVWGRFELNTPIVLDPGKERGEGQIIS